MSQNSLRMSWTREKVDAELEAIMVRVHKNAFDTPLRMASREIRPRRQYRGLPQGRRGHDGAGGSLMVKQTQVVLLSAVMASAPACGGRSVRSHDEAPSVPAKEVRPGREEVRFLAGLGESLGLAGLVSAQIYDEIALAMRIWLSGPRC